MSPEQKYLQDVKALSNPSFQQIRSIAHNYIASLPKDEQDHLYYSLNHGVALLDSHDQLCQYLYAYGNMHEAKILNALQHLQADTYTGKTIQVIDWGCGQGLATVCFLDYLKNKTNTDISRVVLIEPSLSALERAQLHVSSYKGSFETIAVNKFANEITSEDIVSDVDVTIHFFSNILDIESVDIKQLAQTIADAICGEHYFICVGPLNATNQRIEAFYKWFHSPELIWEGSHSRDNHSYTARYKVFKLQRFDTGVILVRYNPPKQFHAAYRIDSIKEIYASDQLKETREKADLLLKSLSAFDVSTPFDIGASIYEDVNPLFAVLSNIVVRGLPTKASCLVENAFAKFGNKRKPDNLGGIQYGIDNLNPDDIFLALHAIDNRFTLNRDSYNKDILDSDLESHYICDVAPKLFQQVFVPQRSLASITKHPSHHSQRVDFACQYPYGKNQKGVVIELDGSRYHTSSHTDSDNNRIAALNRCEWTCKRLNESEITSSNFDYFDSEYLKNAQKAYNKTFDKDWTDCLQIALSPIGIARVQKTIIEALLIKKLNVSKTRWDILVKENDVPCAALAIADLKQMFNHLASLSQEYEHLRFPEVNLTIISSSDFYNSPLHKVEGIATNILNEPNDSIRNHTYDLVIDIAIMRRSGIEDIAFSEFKSRNECYFHIRSSHYVNSSRQIYTSDAIDYKPLVTKESNGEYRDINDLKSHLEYFMQTLFRKESFRSGQLPILSRALQNKCVIGLLPTGGGKSLTYQIAAMLQPGVTVVVDPLRSLMKDQYDGLLKAGIDTCTYVNSTIPAAERERREKEMESSMLQFVFLSPERLCIYGFRDKLRNMHELGVYFSYGVIDEVHCVSEWGHDFRFTYLHLGRNLYNYVLPKQTERKNHITLFGLTATASFDVLADVERELSGNGQFPLDSDTIVRDENTNRLELQYKIEKVPVEYQEDKYYDQKGYLAGFPRALSITDKWAAYDAKRNFLLNYLSEIPEYIRELQTDDSIDLIVDRFFARQNKQRTEVTDLRISMPDDYASNKEEYPESGIVFCPHKNETGVSVNGNAGGINEHMKVGTFMGSSGGDIEESEQIDNESFKNLELFRENKLPLMVATKAFGMGIDKPNVRFTINMNYSSSLESFVQEAGRAGRDRHTALAVILLSDYRLVRINKDRCRIEQFPMKIIKGKWFREEDLNYILHQHNIYVDDSDKDIFSPERDMVKLKCEVCNTRFGFGLCNSSCNRCNKGPCQNVCSLYNQCKLKDVPQSAKGFQYIEDLNDILEQYRITLPKENLEYMNADYETVMYFFNNNFKGSLIEKRTMHELLNKSTIPVFVGNNTEIKEPTEEVTNFLQRLLDSAEGTDLVAFISTKTVGVYNGQLVYIIGGNNKEVRIEDIKTGYVTTVSKDAVEIRRDSADVDKAIYRMCCIGLIDDFTKDYVKQRCRIVAVRKKDGDYYKGLQYFLERYYSKEKAAEEIAKVPDYRGENEIHKCLGYLTEFIYDKIAVKRKRAIDDIRSFCMLGTRDGNWLNNNEELKDFIYYYFNSKYARRDFYYEDLNEPDKSFSLTSDTDEGKKHSMELVYKYMRVIDDDITSLDSSSQIDNVKHLQGAVRLIRRSLTDANPTIDLLNVFCLMFLGIGENESLRNEQKESYISAYQTLYKMYNYHNAFYALIENFKKELNAKNRQIASTEELKTLYEWDMEAELSIHSDWLHTFKKRYVKN